MLKFRLGEVGGDGEEEIKEDPKNGSFLLIFGCKPENGVIANSILLDVIFDKFRSIARHFNGYLILPGIHFVIQRNNFIEFVLKINQQLLLHHAAIVTTGPIHIDS